MAFPQFSIPIQRLKEEWAFRLRMERLRRKRPSRQPSKIAAAAEAVGMVRVLDLDCPLDLFRQPNKLLSDSFDEVFDRGIVNASGTRSRT